jgi:hypothetical protein
MVLFLFLFLHLLCIREVLAAVNNHRSPTNSFVNDVSIAGVGG